MTSISYANIAANGSNGSSPLASKNELSIAPNGAIGDLSQLDKSLTPNENTDKSETKVNGKSDAGGSEKLETKVDSKPEKVTKEKEEEKEEKKDKKLAPAPVPQTSAWGSVSTSSSISTNDEVKWPTPPEDYKQKTANHQKFIKPITKQWVPINAKLILPNARNQPQTNTKKTQKKKNKKKPAAAVPTTTTATTTTTNTVPGGQKKDEKKDKEKLSEKPVNSTPSPTTKSKNDKSDSVSTNSDSSIPLSEPLDQESLDAATPDTNNTPDVENLTEDMKNYAPMNGYYQPQPYPVNYNNRQFRVPSNYRVNRYSLPNNYNNGGFIPMPYPQAPNQHHHSLPLNQFYPGVPPAQQYPPQFQQYYGQPMAPQYQQPPIMVPPPISPKQDPINAFIQQLDYYFSLDNLIKDVYLRKSMNKDGFVGLSSILEFKRVKIILNNIKLVNNSKDFNQLVINSLNNCNNIEVSNANTEGFDLDKVQLRVRDNWKQWVLDN